MPEESYINSAIKLTVITDQDNNPVTVDNNPAHFDGLAWPSSFSQSLQSTAGPVAATATARAVGTLQCRSSLVATSTRGSSCRLRVRLARSARAAC